MLSERDDPVSTWKQDRQVQEHDLKIHLKCLFLSILSERKMQNKNMNFVQFNK